MGKYEARKPRNNRKKRLWILVTAEILVLLALVIGVVAVVNRNPVEGNWYEDGRLTYKFGANGKGVMILTDDLARFRYEIKGKTLYIDFDREDIPDKSYQFSVKNRILTLDDGSADPQSYSRS